MKMNVEKKRAVAVLALVVLAAGADWLQFRGTDQRGRADVAKLPPTDWSVGTADAPAKNITWSVKLPARGVSGPIVIGDTVVVQIENTGESFAAGLDAATGESRWRVDRPAAMNWSSPTAMKSGNETFVLLQSPKKLSAHQPRTGETVWTFDATTGGIS